LKRGFLSLVMVTAIALLSAAALADQSSVSAGLSIGRILDPPNHGDAVQFTANTPESTSLNTPVFRTRFSMSLGSAHSSPILFGDVGESFDSSATQSTLRASNGQVLGLSFRLLGAQSSVSFVNSASSWNAQTSPETASQSPAVFAFYNFPQVAPDSSLRNVFGFGGQTAALAEQSNILGGDAADSSATSLLSFPLVSSLSAQGPYWYGGYTPALSGSSVQLSIPVRVARLGLKVRFGEQTLDSVQPTSLANQILGPAFASASDYNAFNGGFTLALPLLNRQATVSLDGLYQSLQQGNGQAFNPAAGQADSMPVQQSSGPIVLYPASTNLQQYVGAASLALPVTSRLTVKGSFSEQLAGTVDLDALTQSLTQHTTAYAGGLVYNIPRTNSSINFVYNRNVYTDDATASSWTENRQNLYFSVKF
jgi:hypothetical protein